MLLFAKETTDSIPKRRVLLGLKILLLSLTGFVSFVVGHKVSFFPVGVFSGFFACVIASIIFRWGWLVPCTLAGAIIGIMLDSKIKGGTAESQAWETFVNFSIGLGCGIVAGVQMEFGNHHPKSIEPIKDASESDQT